MEVRPAGAAGVARPQDLLAGGDGGAEGDGEAGAVAVGPSGAGGVGDGAVRAITIAGTSTVVEKYRYDCNGSITEVQEDLNTTPVTWTYRLNSLNRVQAVQRNSDPVSTNAYDVTGQRVLRQDPDGKRILYLGAIEISHTTAGGLSAVKQYPSIQRTPTGVTFTASNHQGSLAATLSNTSTTSYLRYKPYGDQRGPGTAPNQRAFLNEVNDTSQSLTYLNQRSVDTQTGTFTTVDPLTVSTRDPYIYANANPIGLSDPSGLCSSERACETAIRQCENGGGVWDGLSGTCGSKPNLTVDRLVGSKSIADTGPLTGDEKMISVAPSTTLPNSNCPDKVESGCGSVRVGLNAEHLRRVALLKEFLVRYQKNSKDLIVGAAWSSWPGSPVPLVPLPDAQVQLRADLGDYAGAAYVAVTVLEVGGKGLAGGSNGGYGGPSALSVLSLAAARSHPVASASLAGADIILATGVLGNEEDNFEYEGSVQVTLGVVAYDFDGSTLAVDLLPLQWMDVDITGLGDISVEDGVATARIQLPGLGYTEVTSGISLLLGDP